MRTPSFVPPTAEFCNLARTLALADGSALRAADMLQELGCERAARVCRAAVTAGTLADPAYAALANDYRSLSAAFLEGLRSISVFDALVADAMVVVPLQTRVVAVNTFATASEVGDGAMMPVTRLSLSAPQLAVRKVAAITVPTKDVLQFANGPSLPVLTRELRAGAATATSRVFLTELVSEAAAVGSSGSTAANVLTDVAALLDAVRLRAGSRPYLIVDSQTAAHLSTKNSGGLPAFPEMTFAGGTLAGIPCLVSDSLPSVSPNVAVLLVDAAAFIANPGFALVDGSGAADVQLDDAPSEGASSVLTSMFQTNMVALRVVRYFGFEQGRSSAVAMLTGAQW